MIKIETCNMENIDTKTKEGKYLLACISILTTNVFKFKENYIDGTKKHPDEIFIIIGDLVNDIFSKKEG